MTNLDALQPDVPSQLIERFATGDRSAYTTFYRMLLPAARGVARGILHDSHLVDDAVQEASLKAWQAAPGFRTGNGRAWFLRIVRNTSLNMAASRARTDVTAPEDLHRAAGGVRVAGEQDVPSADVGHFTAGFVREAWFRRLAPREQKIVLLRSLGYPNAEILHLVPEVTHNEIIRRALVRAARSMRRDPGALAAAVAS